MLVFTGLEDEVVVDFRASMAASDRLHGTYAGTAELDHLESTLATFVGRALVILLLHHEHTLLQLHPFVLEPSSRIFLEDFLVNPF